MTSRRQFLKIGLAAVAVLHALPSHVSAIALDLVEKKKASRKVVVLGAGLAGLAAAYELSRAGMDVTVLEARTSPGGRVHTLREAFADGMYAEAGGQYFYPVEPDYAMSYIKAFGLEIVPLQVTGKQALGYFRGKRFKRTRTAQIDWPLDLTAEEKSLGLAGMRQKYVEPAIKELLRVFAHDWPEAILASYGQKSFSGVLQEYGASHDAIELLRIMDWDFVGEEPHITSALELLSHRASFSLLSKPFYAIKGGNDLLPKAFAERLRGQIRYGAVARRIEHGADAVRVIYRQGDESRALGADYLVSALPFSVLRRLEVSPPFSREKQRIIEELPYNSITRVYLQSKTKFWSQQGLSGLSSTDLPITYFWDATWAQEGPRGVLQAFATGATARRMAAMDDNERISLALEQAEKIYPEIRENFEGGITKCWDTDPWAFGGYSWYRLGPLISLLPSIATPEGRVHFAGEHTASIFKHGTMQGALESGLRVARGITEAR